MIQTYGRVARLDTDDRSLIEDKTITPDELDKMNKPYAWIIIPAVKNEDTDKLANLEGIIGELRDMGFNPAEDIEPNDRGRGEGDDGRDDIVPSDSGLGRIVAQVIEDYDHKIEEERVASLTFEDKIKNEGKKTELNLDF